MALAQARQTHCVNGHLLDAGNLYVRRDGKRQCKICTRGRSRRHLAKLRAQGRAPTKPPEWHREYRREVKQGLRTPQRRARITDPYTVRILDILVTDGGWLSVVTIAMMLDAKEETVRTSLQRMRGRGWVESRYIELGLRAGRRGTEGRFEWRALTDLDRFV